MPLKRLLYPCLTLCLLLAGCASSSGQPDPAPSETMFTSASPLATEPHAAETPAAAPSVESDAPSASDSGAEEAAEDAAAPTPSPAPKFDEDGPFSGDGDEARPSRPAREFPDDGEARPSRSAEERPGGGTRKAVPASPSAAPSEAEGLAS